MNRTALHQRPLSPASSPSPRSPAFANDINIRQYGWQHSAGGEQTGWRNRIGVHQEGRPQQCHSASERQPQRRCHRTGRPPQQRRPTFQAGRNNAAGLAQFGSRHQGMIVQDGNGNIAAGIQIGQNCDGYVSQSGQRQRRGLRPDLQLNEALGETVRPPRPRLPIER